MKRVFSALFCVLFLFLTPLNMVSYADNIDAQHGYYYNNLNDNQKAVYDTFIVQPFFDLTKVTLVTPLEYDSNYTGFDSDNSGDLNNIVAVAAFSFAYDNPQYYWFRNCAYSAADVTTTDNADTTKGKYHITVAAVNVMPRTVENVVPNAADAQAKTTEMMSAVSEIKISGHTLFDRVKSIHDTVINLIVYNTDSSGEGTDLRHLTMGAFLEPHSAVCEAYAAAFKLLCDREGIPCIMVIGKLNTGSHAWDYVKMEDDKWYAVDCTRDDNGENIYYDDFLVGSQSLKSHFGSEGETFSDNHNPNGFHWALSDFNFIYPELSDNSYFPLALGVNSLSTVNAARTKLIIPPDTSADNEAQVPQGYFAMAMENKTGGTLYVYKTEGIVLSAQYTFVMRGDVVADGEINNDDYNKVTSIVSGTSPELTCETDGYLAADYNNDGAVDAFDMFYLDLYINTQSNS